MNVGDLAVDRLEHPHLFEDHPLGAVPVDRQNLATSHVDPLDAGGERLPAGEEVLVVVGESHRDPAPLLERGVGVEKRDLMPAMFTEEDLKQLDGELAATDSDATDKGGVSKKKKKKKKRKKKRSKQFKDVESKKEGEGLIIY